MGTSGGRRTPFGRGVDGRTDARHRLLPLDDCFLARVPAPLRRYLILDHHRREPSLGL